MSLFEFNGSEDMTSKNFSDFFAHIVRGLREGKKRVGENLRDPKSFFNTPVGSYSFGYDVVLHFKDNADNCMIQIQHAENKSQMQPIYHKGDTIEETLLIFDDVFKALGELKSDNYPLNWIKAVGFITVEGWPNIFFRLDNGEINLVQLERYPEPDPFISEEEAEELVREDFVFGIAIMKKLNYHSQTISKDLIIASRHYTKNQWATIRYE